MTRPLPARLMQWSLLALAAYFLLIAAAHVTGTKLPLLFVYFNVPSTAYQDNIIAFLAFGWAMFFFTAARDPATNRPLIRALLLAAGGAVAGLSHINLTTDFAALAPNIAIWPFWAQTGILAGILIWLSGLYVAIRPKT